MCLLLEKLGAQTTGQTSGILERVFFSEREQSILKQRKNNS